MHMICMFLLSTLSKLIIVIIIIIIIIIIIAIIITTKVIDIFLFSYGNMNIKDSS